MYLLFLIQDAENTKNKKPGENAQDNTERLQGSAGEAS